MWLFILMQQLFAWKHVLAFFFFIIIETSVALMISNALCSELVCHVVMPLMLSLFKMLYNEIHINSCSDHEQ